ncbi:MAG TPA: hypothetical protein VMC06_05115 [Opitutaceae bacterium]|nr:hypothetical protein [Opitutaceae bacterium]
MKTILRLALLASLALNAAFAFFVFTRPAAPAPSAPATPAVDGPVAPPPIDQNVWPDLQTDDLSALAARLRASGFPPALVRAILAAQLDEQFAARRKALRSAEANLPFWKGQTRDPKLAVALVQLDREQQKLLRQLLGGDAETEDPRSRLYQNRSLDFLPTDKANTLSRLLRDYDERRSDLYASGFSSNTDRAKFDALGKEQHDALARVLTPAELVEYDLRNSSTAETLRTNLSAFNPSEAEFRALYPLQAAYDERWGNELGLTLSADERRQRDDAQKLLTDQIKAALGPERAANYERTTDYNYRRTNQLVERLELSPETTNTLWAVQKEFQQRRMDIYRTASPEERVSQLTALQQEAIARVTPLLGGASGVEAYKQYGGSWLQSMLPRPAPSRP